jgi:signal transduction histidine kinase
VTPDARGGSPCDEHRDGRVDLTALDLVPEAVVVVDHDRRVVHTNDRVAPLLGLGQDVVGAPLEDVLALTDDAGNPWVPVPADALPGSRLAERVLRVHLPDGRRRAVALSGRVLDDGRAVLTFRSAGRRERVDAARSDLVATVSHEIRSPLTSVKGFTKTMLSRWDRFSDDQKRAMLATINADADRVTRLLRELLDVSRIDAGRVQVHPQRVDVPRLVDDVVDKAAHRPEGDDRAIVVRTDGELPPVWADPDKVEQIVTNLVENALKYAPDSQVRITATSSDDTTVRITVADDGPGIPADQRRSVFEKFGRGRGTRRSGTGLGLFITRGLAEAMRGRVWCESEPGEGASFHVELPRWVPPEPRTPSGVG